jgi:hypothetical protein
MLVIQTLYQAMSVKIVRPTMLTRICIQIALLILDQNEVTDE